MSITITVSVTDAAGSTASATTTASQVISTGFPDATTTGVIPGTVLTNSGPITTTANGQVISGKNITISQSAGTGITVAHNNVTIQNCKITGMGVDTGIYLNPGQSGLKVLNCEIFGTPGQGLPNANNRTSIQLVNGIRTDDAVSTNSEIAFCNIYGVENAICSVDSYIHDNYFHDFAYWTFGGDGTHVDCIQTYDAGNIPGMIIRNNTLLGIATCGMFTPATAVGASSCIALSLNQYNVTIDNNLMAGGSFTCYGPNQSGSGGAANIHITNNRFSTQLYPKCGEYGIFDGFNSNAPGYQFSGNVWHETGAPVTINN